MKPFPQLTTADRADIVDRVFEKKVRDYIAFVRNSNTFGHVTAELPDPKVYANGHRIISELMIYGPRRYTNRNASCMKDGSRCNRNFPKAYYDKTNISCYRQRHHPTDTAESTTNVPGIQVDEIKNYVEARYIGPHEAHKLIFIYGHGGTGKTFLWKVITTALRSEEKIVLTVASSGIVSLLLPSGRTAHSRFQLPLNLKDESTCHIKKNSQLVDLLRRTNLIIWDEAPMNDRRCFETLDRCLRDILDSPHTLFGGCNIMLGGDFRLTLGVKKKASKPEIINTSITSSYLWEGFKIYTLTQNMRLYQSDLTEAQKQCLYQFSTWLLNIGDGNIGCNAPLRKEDVRS
nr:DNA helicase [Tanacetum cinerariifolium]